MRVCVCVYVYMHMYIKKKPCKDPSLPLPPLCKLKPPLNQYSLIKILRKVEIFEVEDQPIWQWPWNVFPT